MSDFIRDWLLPPEVSRRMDGITRRLRDREQTSPLSQECQPGGLDDIRVAAIGETIWVGIDKLRVWGRSLHYTQNQYVRYFSDGFQSLKRFYDLHQPNDQIEALFLNPNSVGAYRPISYPFLRNPWTFQQEYRGEGRHGPNHGFQGYGPLSKSKLRFEAKRLEILRESVTRTGFRQTNGQDSIRFGLLLINDSSSMDHDYRLEVVGGRHRVALLAHLGWSHIPMSPQPSYPLREIHLSQLRNWPGVLDGTFSKQAAKEVFLAYFRDGNENLLPDW